MNTSDRPGCNDGETNNRCVYLQNKLKQGYYFVKTMFYWKIHGELVGLIWVKLAEASHRLSQ